MDVCTTRVPSQSIMLHSLNTTFLFTGFPDVLLSRRSGVAGRIARTQEQTRAVMYRCVWGLERVPERFWQLITDHLGTLECRRRKQKCDR